MRRELLLLREMIDAAERIRELMDGLDLNGLRADTLRREAVLWNYTVLGEAAGQVPDDVKHSHREVAWTQPVRLRNRIVHGYWDIDLQILHDTAIEDLPTMIDQLTDIVARLDNPGADDR